MKIAVTATGEGMHAAVDSRFGRAQCFVIVDSDTDEVTTVDNVQNLNAPQGAGVQAGKTVVDLGAEALLTGNVGPKAFATLSAGGVRVYTGATGTVADALARFRAGRLAPAEGANVPGHWS